MSEQELQLKKYVIKTYVEELLRKLETKKTNIDAATPEELDNIIDEIYNDISEFTDETNRFKKEKIK